MKSVQPPPSVQPTLSVQPALSTRPAGGVPRGGYLAPRGGYRAPGTPAPPRPVGVPGGGGGSTAFALRGVPVWQNQQYNPGRNDGGYTRYDHTQRGSGLEHSKTFADGARTFETYNKLQQGQPGYTHAQNARQNLTEMGVTAATASDEQKFDAMDLAMRGAMFKNKRKKRSFGIGDIAKLAAAAAATWVTAGAAAPYFGASAAGTAATGALAGAAGATTSGVLNNNLSLQGVATGAALGGLKGPAGSVFGGATEAEQMANALRASKLGYI